MMWKKVGRGFGWRVWQEHGMAFRILGFWLLLRSRPLIPLDGPAQAPVGIPQGKRNDLCGGMVEGAATVDMDVCGERPFQPSQASGEVRRRGRRWKATRPKEQVFCDYWDWASTAIPPAGSTQGASGKATAVRNGRGFAGTAAQGARPREMVGLWGRAPTEPTVLDLPSL
ncbi:hypothetical protein BU26DRAFT_183910 [Trematosphaeria pertusa]|uniref:Uncharacterized protein n=1 Tax=Trematosphaeria pertusa TaxID=390896 RepID=A0A6A6HTB3_9PLEO|nr:uncharacterized protein BU26DRAFT_183910 [Trematosphaeria pertusa]KAF2241257.1 hypothetical protein BU26DRAFT_183910 [Trematosphaeria pertusa]